MGEAKLDFIEDRFTNQKIKTQKVLCQDCNVQEFGDIIIPAPAGVVIDPLTGTLNANVTLRLNGTPQLRNVTVLPGKVVNQGIVPAVLLVNGVVLIECLEIPLEAL